MGGSSPTAVGSPTGAVAAARLRFESSPRQRQPVAEIATDAAHDSARSASSAPPSAGSAAARARSPVSAPSAAIGGTDSRPTFQAPLAAYTALGILETVAQRHDAVVWENTAVRVLGKMVDVIMRNAGIVADTSVFLVSSRIGDDSNAVFVERMTEEGTLATSSLDAMCGVENPRVIIVNFMIKSGRVRVTATRSC